MDRAIEIVSRMREDAIQTLSRGDLWRDVSTTRDDSVRLDTLTRVLRTLKTERDSRAANKSLRKETKWK